MYNTKIFYIPENDLVTSGIECLQDRLQILKLELLHLYGPNVILNSLKLMHSKFMKEYDNIPGQWQWCQSYPSEGPLHPQAPLLSFPLKDWRHINTFQTNIISYLVCKPLDRAHPHICPRRTWADYCRQWCGLTPCHQKLESWFLNIWNIKNTGHHVVPNLTTFLESHNGQT